MIAVIMGNLPGNGSFPIRCAQEAIEMFEWTLKIMGILPENKCFPITPGRSGNVIDESDSCHYGKQP